MSTTIEQLDLKVESNATSAVSSLDSLASTLGKLKNATKGGLGLTTVCKQITGLNTALAGMNGASADNLNKLAQGLSSLSALKDLKISSSIGNQITSIGQAVRSIGGVDFSPLTSLANSLAPLSTIGKSNLNSFISQLSRLPQALKGLKDVDFNDITAQIQKLSAAMSPLAAQMQQIASGFASLPKNIKAVVANTNILAQSNDVAAKSYTNLAAKLATVWIALKTTMKFLASCVNKSNEYVESLNLFTVSMGEFAEEAQAYAETVAEVMGIDPSTWLKNQGVFMTLATGFGVVNDRAYVMSQNLTQLGYDLSSFFNLPVEETMQKIQSGISGELEPLRRLGYDLSVARLQQEAYALGIEKSVNAMTQAEKAELRYYAIMTQVTTAQGDMARTLEAPANQLRILKAQVEQAARSIGNIFIPILNAVLPYAIAVAKVIRMIADAIASLFGFALPEIDYSGLGSAAGGASDLADSLGDAGEKAKEVKNALLGIDELNIISPEDNSGGSGSGAGVGGGSGLGFELPTYDFIGDAVTGKVDEIVQKMREWLGLTEEINSWSDFFHTRLGRILTTVGAIALGIAAWKISKSFLDGLQYLKTLQNMGLTTPLLLTVGISLVVTGVALEWSGIIDAIQNELNGMNLSQIIAGALTTTLGGGVIGKALTKVLGTQLAKTAGNAALVSAGTFSATFASTLFTGGIAAIVAGIPAFVTGVWDSIQNGLSLLSGLLTEFGATLTGAGAGAIGAALGAWGGPIGIAVGALIGVVVGALVNFGIWLAQNWDEVSAKASEFWQGICSFFSETVPAWWTGTVVPFFSGIIEKIKGVLDTIKQWIVDKWNAAIEYLQGVPAKIGEVIKSVGQWFSELPGKIGYALGYALGSIVKWAQDTYATLKEKIPEIVAKVTTWFSELPGKIWNAIVTAVNKVATWGSEMWRKFKEKVDSIVLSVTSWFSALPGKIWNAIIAAKDKIVSWASEMIAKVKEKVPEIISSIVGFFEEIPGKLKALGEDIWQGLVDGLTNAWNTVTTAVSDFCSNFLQGFKDALGIESPSKEFMTIGGYSADGLIEGVYGKFSAVKETVTEWGSKVISWFTGNSDGAVNKDSFATFGGNIVGGFKDKISSAYTTVRSSISTWASDVKNRFTNSSFGGINNTSFANYAQNVLDGFKNKISTTYTTVRTSIATWASDIKTRFSNGSYGGINSSTFSNYANSVITGFKDKISSAYTNVRSAISTWASDIKTRFNSSSYGGVNSSTFTTYAQNVIDGFKNKVSSYYTQSQSSVTTWAGKIKTWFTDINTHSAWGGYGGIAFNIIEGFADGIWDWASRAKNAVVSWGQSVIDWFQNKIEEHSPSKVFYRSGMYTVLGYNNGITEYANSTKKIISQWADSFTTMSPTMAFAVDTSALDYYSGDSLVKSVYADVSASGKYAVEASFATGELKQAMMEAMIETGLIDDVRRQADKNEQTIVQIGNRTVSDAVTTQQKANGFVFAK